MDMECKPECATDAEGQPREPLTTTCGECKRSWCARCHPAPSARCHFEYQHVNATHWHVQRHGEDDDVYAGGLVDALDYAAGELDRIADHEHDGVAAHGEAGQFEDAYACVKRVETYNGLVLNLRNMHAQHTLSGDDLAPLYRPENPRAAEALGEALTSVCLSVVTSGPAGFRIWECAEQECAPEFEDEPEYEVDDSGSAEPVPLPSWLTAGQRRTVEHWQAYNVPAEWFIRHPDEDGSGAVRVIALSLDVAGGFIWSFVIDPDGEFSSSEATVGPWETGVTI